LNPNQFVAIILCYGTFEDVYGYRGYIKFHADGTLLPPAVHDAGSHRIYLHLNLCQFDAAIEVLRTEQPLYLTYVNPATAFLRSGVEPTGEEET
jgi:hypothetical protein